MIGDKYDINEWNCTHEVAEWYRTNGYPDLLKGVTKERWDLHFVRFMRKKFLPLEKYEQGALVLMTNKYTGGLHVGVWDRGMIHHCYAPADGSPGQTIRSPIGFVKNAHKNITFWRLKSV
ncbi:MAG: putative N-acetyltransferase [Siphoviridae sp. ctdc_1]|nr:MAG: putative N-acetyltransferase [Siphoviridae sp. ctdc_1]